MALLHFLFDPFALGFMRRALVGCLALSLAGPPLGVILVLRRMSLTSDVLQHGMLPGVALGALAGGLTVPAMGLGAFLAGLAVALLASWLAAVSGGAEDSQLAGVFLVALAFGVALVSATRGIDLTALLFGNVLAVNNAALLFMAGAATVALVGLAVIWRPLVLESFDPGFLQALGGHGGVWHLAYMALVVACVVGGLTALGTLMSIGLMMLPAVAARHFSAELPGQVAAAALLAIVASIAGLLLSFWGNVPAGPAIVLCAGLLWALGLLAGPRASLRARLWRPHFRD